LQKLTPKKGLAPFSPTAEAIAFLKHPSGKPLPKEGHPMDLPKALGYPIFLSCPMVRCEKKLLPPDAQGCGGLWIGKNLSERKGGATFLA
jgi:hypothetical protein